MCKQAIFNILLISLLSLNQGCGADQTVSRQHPATVLEDSVELTELWDLSVLMHVDRSKWSPAEVRERTSAVGMNSSIAVSDDSRLGAVRVGTTGFVMVFDLKTGLEQWRWNDESSAGGPADLAFSPDSSVLVVCSHRDQLAMLFEAGSGKVLRELNGDFSSPRFRRSDDPGTSNEVFFLRRESVFRIDCLDIKDGNIRTVFDESVDLTAADLPNRDPQVHVRADEQRDYCIRNQILVFGFCGQLTGFDLALRKILFQHQINGGKGGLVNLFELESPDSIAAYSTSSLVRLDIPTGVIVQTCRPDRWPVYVNNRIVFEVQGVAPRMPTDFHAYPWVTGNSGFGRSQVRISSAGWYGRNCARVTRDGKYLLILDMAGNMKCFGIAVPDKSKP